MSIKQQPVYVCDNCGTEMAVPSVYTEDVPHEGYSEIRMGLKSFPVGGQHYCCFSCLVEHIGRELDTKTSPKKKGPK